MHACASLILAALTLAPAGPLRVDGDATRVRIHEQTFDVRLVVHNASGRTLEADVSVELLDPDDVVHAHASMPATIAPGLQALDVALRPGIGDLQHEQRLLLLQYRLRYRLELAHAPAGVAARLAGVLALSRLTPDVFELRLMADSSIQAGRTLDVAVRAAHPVTLRPVGGVAVEARLELADERVVSATRTTDARGLASFKLVVPNDVESHQMAELKAVGRRAGIETHVSTDVGVARVASVVVSTDKPLYQPGQVLHLRALVRGFENGPALGDLPLVVKVEDEHGDAMFEAALVTSRFGVASADWPIPEHVRLGRYQILAEADEKHGGYQGAGASHVRVSRYELPQFAVRVVPSQPYYQPGQQPSLEVHADYLFGKPVTRGQVRVALESKHEWNYKLQRYDVEERGHREGALSTNGTFAATFDEEVADDFPDDDDSQLYRDVDGTAYVTDATTGRTEQRRFSLRLTYDAIHVYLVERYRESCADSQERVCRASFYVSTSYADGTPAACDVRVARRIRWPETAATQDGPEPLQALASVRTNRYGLASVPEMQVEAPRRDESELDGDTELVVTAQDGRGRRGRIRRELGGWGSSRVLVDAGHAVHVPGQPIEVSLRSQGERGPVLIDIGSEQGVLVSQVVSLRGSTARAVFPYRPSFKGVLKVSATVLRYGPNDYYRAESGSYGVVYPTGPDLRLDVDADHAQYRPGAVAQVRLALRRGTGRAVPGVLGLVVLDQALEERAASEPGLPQPAGFLGAFSPEPSLAGVSLRDLLALDTAQPVPADLDLVAELLLRQGRLPDRGEETSDDFDRDTGRAFAKRFAADLHRESEALGRRFAAESDGPADLESARRALSDGAPGFESRRDPWERPYRLRCGPRGARTVVEFLSDGPDRLTGTDDDLVALAREWAYFASRARLVERAAQQYYDRSAVALRDLDTLRTELVALGAEVDTWRDPWGHGLAFRFSLAGTHARVTALSPGPDGAFATADDVELSNTYTDYFARQRAKLQAALDAILNESGEFPQTEAAWAALMARAGIEGERDVWGHPFELVFRAETHYVNRVAIRAYARLDGTRGKRIAEAPVSGTADVLSLWSRGPDGKLGNDDFQLCSFRRMRGDRESALDEPSPAEARVHAQGRGAIAGTVTDTSGAVIPGVQVSAKRGFTGDEVVVATDAHGAYLLDVAAGSHTVTTSLSGFQTVVVTGVPVEHGRTTQLDVVLSVGAMEESIEVAAATQMLAQTSRALGMVLERPGTLNLGPPPIATPRVRRDFPETLYWQPALETDTQGNARVSVKLADTLTTWKLAAVASTTDGQVATVERALMSFQPFFVENDPPPILTAGDAIALPAVLRNYTRDALRASIDATASDGLRIAGAARQEVRVAPDDSARAVFDLRADQASKQALVRLTASSAREGDAVEKRLTVHPDGARTEVASGALVGHDAVLELDIPARAIPGSIEARIDIAPNLAAHVLESVEAVMHRPYGCMEQTVSSTYPSLMALRLVAGGGEPLLEAHAHRYLEQGYQRLRQHMGAEGGWAYFDRGEPDLALTAYALRFLDDARAFVDVDPQTLERARAFLLSKQEPNGRWRAPVWRSSGDEHESLALTALVARTLAGLSEPAPKPAGAGADVGAALTRALAYLAARADEREDPYMVASLALAAHAAHAEAQERGALVRLRALARAENQGVYWAYETNTPFYGWGLAGRIETTALAVKALAQADEGADRGLADKGLLFLLRNRDHYGMWWSSQATVNVLDALVTVIGRLSPGGDTSEDALDVVVNGRKVETLVLPSAARRIGPLTADVSAHVVPGANRVELHRSRDGGKVSAHGVATYYLPWAEARLRSSDALRFDVRFDKLEARVGETIGVHVEAERVGFEGYGMLLAEIGLPPGGEVDRESLERAREAAGFSLGLFEIQPDRVVLYLWPRAGGTSLDFVVRPRLGMRAQSAASILYDYYNPEAMVTRPPQALVVRE